MVEDIRDEFEVVSFEEYVNKIKKLRPQSVRNEECVKMYTMQLLTLTKVMLMSEGIPPYEEILRCISEAEISLYFERIQIGSKIKARMIKSFLILFVGVFLTVATYFEALKRGGGTYYIMYGAIFGGIIEVVRTICIIREINDSFETYETNFWNDMKLKIDKMKCEIRNIDNDRVSNM